MPRPTYTIEIFEDETSQDGSESRSTPDLVDKRSDGVEDSEREHSDNGPPSPQPYDTFVPAGLIRQVGREDDGFDVGLDEYEARDVVKDIHPPMYKVSGTYSNRNFSTGTAIHRSSYQYDDPFEEEASRRSSDYARDFLSHPDEDVDLSDGVSAFPEELDISNDPPWPPSGTIRPVGGQRAKQGRYYSSPTRERQDSTPRNRSLPSNRKNGQRASTHSPNVSPHRYSGAFRNPSSVIAMQMSSPSPPPFARSPRSARHNRNGTNMSTMKSQGGSPSRQFAHPPEQKKEYPLILLHCSVNMVELPYEQATIQEVLPQWLQQNLALLKEKVGPTVVDRGILVAHPGEDYELLEERILESLELKCPRVGKCGHFIGDGELSKHLNVNSTEDQSTALVDPRAFSDPVCDDCGRHIAIGMYGTGTMTDTCHQSRRWDIRVYAANGLLRAGAWSAAWKEMESVDIEVGAWIPEEIRQTLEQTAELAFQEARDVDADWDQTHYPTEDGPTPKTERAASTGASKARVSSLREHEMEDPPSADSTPSSRDTYDFHVQTEPLPLSTLLFDYLRRKASQHVDIIIVLSLLALALAYVLGGAKDSSKAPSLPSFNQSETPVVETPAPVAQVPIPPVASEHSVLTTTTTVTEEKTNKLPACTFKRNEHGDAMTVLPADLARRVLDAIATPTTMAALTKTSMVEKSSAMTEAPIVEYNAVANSKIADNAPLPSLPADAKVEVVESEHLVSGSNEPSIEVQDEMDVDTESKEDNAMSKEGVTSEIVRNEAEIL